MTQSELEKMAWGDPLDYVMEGVDNIPPANRRGHANLSTPVREKYGTDISNETADVIKQLHNAVDGTALIRAIQKMGLDSLDDYEAVLSGCDLEEGDEANLGRVMRELDVKLHNSLADRETSIELVSKKTNRESVYVPEIINNLGEGGTVYMAKTLNATSKVRMAWDLHDENVVLVVDDYDKWESLLGWQKLKQFPHGKNKIREELGDQLSTEVLDIVAPQGERSSDMDKEESSSSSGRRKRTPPTDEVINVAIGSSHRSRQKIKAEEILESFEDDGKLSVAYKSVEMLVLFPTTCDLNMTDHWWVPGHRWDGGGYAAIANCNKGTFEYLNQRDEVWHIEDYLEQAGDYEFDTTDSWITLDAIDQSQLVIHVCSEETQARFSKDSVRRNLKTVIPEFAEEEMYRQPEFPHSDDMTLSVLTNEDIFWMRPVLRNWDSEEGGIILKADTSVRDLRKTWSLPSDYKLYARARLPNWDFDSPELSTLDRASYSIELEKGGYEIVETLAQLHDNDEQLFSQTPKARWG